MPVKAVRCCQAYSGDPEHHDKPSHPAARHDRLDGDAARDFRIACADRAARRGASQGRNPSGSPEGRAKGRSARCRAEGARTGRTASTSGCGASAPSSAAAAPAGCSSATASDTTPAASGGRTPAPDASSATPGGRSKGTGTAAAAPSAGRRAEGTGSTPATPCGGTFASDTAAAPSTGSGASGAEATGHTDDSSTTAAAFIPEGDAITRAAAATGRRQAVAGTRHHAGSDSTTNGRPATRRKYDGAFAAYRPTNDTAECGRAHSGTGSASRTSRLAAACRAKRWRPRRSGRNTAGRCTYGTDRGAGRTECCAAARPGPECPADGCSSLPPGTSNHRTAAGGPATGSRRDQSHCPRHASRRTAAP